MPGPATDVVTGLTDLVATIRDDDRTYGLIRRRGRRLEHRVGALRGRPPTVRALHEEVLGDVPPGMRFVPDAVAAESSVRTGAAGAAYVLPPTRVERIRAVIAEGGTLPVKSTYFWPKPRTGMVIRPFDP